jgi:hypothetical protein
MDRATRRRMTDQVMQSVAALLPPEYRGVYGAAPTPGNGGDPPEAP